MFVVGCEFCAGGSFFLKRRCSIEVYGGTRIYVVPGIPKGDVISEGVRNNIDFPAKVRAEELKSLRLRPCRRFCLCLSLSLSLPVSLSLSLCPPGRRVSLSACLALCLAVYMPASPGPPAKQSINQSASPTNQPANNKQSHHQH
jgi:hypothetical protein